MGKVRFRQEKAAFRGLTGRAGFQRKRNDPSNSWGSQYIPVSPWEAHSGLLRSIQKGRIHPYQKAVDRAEERWGAYAGVGAATLIGIALISSNHGDSGTNTAYGDDDGMSSMSISPQDYPTIPTLHEGSNSTFSISQLTHAAIKQVSFLGDRMLSIIPSASADEGTSPNNLPSWLTLDGEERKKSLLEWYDQNSGYSDYGKGGRHDPSPVFDEVVDTLLKHGKKEDFEILNATVNPHRTEDIYSLLIKVKLEKGEPDLDELSSHDLVQAVTAAMNDSLSKKAVNILASRREYDYLIALRDCTINPELKSSIDDKLKLPKPIFETTTTDGKPLRILNSYTLPGDTSPMDEDTFHFSASRQHYIKNGFDKPELDGLVAWLRNELPEKFPGLLHKLGIDNLSLMKPSQAVSLAENIAVRCLQYSDIQMEHSLDRSYLPAFEESKFNDSLPLIIVLRYGPYQAIKKLIEENGSTTTQWDVVRDNNGKPVLDSSGNGVCRNYSRLIDGLLQAMKELSPNLQDLFSLTPSGYTEEYARKHARGDPTHRWNLVGYSAPDTSFNVAVFDGTIDFIRDPSQSEKLAFTDSPLMLDFLFDLSNAGKINRTKLLEDLVRQHRQLPSYLEVRAEDLMRALYCRDDDSLRKMNEPGKPLDSVKINNELASEVALELNSRLFERYVSCPDKKERNGILHQITYLNLLNILGRVNPSPNGAPDILAALTTLNGKKHGSENHGMSYQGVSASNSLIYAQAAEDSKAFNEILSHYCSQGIERNEKARAGLTESPDLNALDERIKVGTIVTLASYDGIADGKLAEEFLSMRDGVKGYSLRAFHSLWKMNREGVTNRLVQEFYKGLKELHSGARIDALKVAKKLQRSVYEKYVADHPTPDNQGTASTR